MRCRRSLQGGRLAACLVAAFFLLGAWSVASGETYREAVEGTTGVSHFWPMGEASGSSFADVVGSANAETSGGVTLGEPGGLAEGSATSALFNGSSGAAHAEVDLSGTHELTVEFWMKWSSFAEDDHLALEFTPNFNEYAGGFLVDPDASPGTDFAVSIGEGGARNTVYFERPSAGAWHYYAFVIDTEAPAETEITPYVDGRAVSYTKSESGTGAGSFAHSTLFWMSRDASTLFGAGSMQDLALYDTTLSASTIAEHYELGEGGPKASFTSAPAVATAGVPVRLDASASSSPAGSIVDYAWDFDGSKSYATDGGGSATISHTFSSPGTYTVDLRVKDSLGQTATVSHTITVGAELGHYEQAVEETPSVTHFWPMAESSGSSFADVIGGANAEALGGVTLGEPGGLVGDSSTAAAFDGTSGAARAEVDLSGTHQLTVEFWMKWKTFAEDDHLAMELTPNFNEYPGGFLIDPDASGTDEFGVGVGEGGSRNNAYFARPSAEEWHYYAFTFDTTASGADQITPYVDGHAVSYTKGAEGTGAGTFAKAMLYWMSRDASTLFGAGSMQDLALYDTTLSSSTIAEHYELGEGGPKASFTSTPAVAAAGSPVRIDASASSSPAGSITDYAWDFDGSKSYSTDGGSSATISHTFSSPGTYTVDLRVKDSLGQTATVSHTITVGAALGQYEQAVEETPDVAHFWPMDESSGSSFADVLDGANASLTGGVSLGEPGGLVEDSSTSAAFNGSSGAAHAAVNLSGTHKLTVEFWMKWTSYAEDDHLALEFTPNFNEYAGGFLVDPDASPGTDFAVSIGEGGARNTVYFERPSAGAWHYYAFVINTEAPAETEITPYVDGYAVSYTKTESGTGASAFANSTLYWMSRDASTLFGKGSMQDLALYETTLDSSTILEHYERGENTYKVANTTAPSIEGVTEDGATLTADPGVWSGATPVAYAYQWQSCNSEGGACEDIEGATAQHYTISSADLETTLRVIVTATNPGGSLPATSAASAEVEAGAPVELEAPSVSGTPAVGETLQANAGVWGGTETEVSYQWERCNSSGGECSDIAGATESGYTLIEGDVGKTLRIRVGASNALGSLTAVSPPSPEIEATAATLTNTWAPSISGTPRDGQTLTANAGSWLGLGTIGYEYQWQRCDRYGNGCENITGATTSTRSLASGDVEHTLRVLVSATETGGTVTETSPTTSAIAAAGDPTIEESPTISGTGLVGYALTASTGAWSGEAPISYAYQWERCNEAGASCSSISGATAGSYTLTESDVAHVLRVLVTATDGAGSTVGASTPTAVVSPTTLVNISAPSISGPHELGRALSADPGIWTGSGAIAFSYQWKRCNEHGESCSSISGASEPTYTSKASDVGDTIEVLVTATGTSGTDSVASAPTLVIVSEPIAPINVIAPTIEGNLTAGDTLTAERGTWLGSEPITYGYQWQKCDKEGEECANISGATADTYTLPEGDVGSTLQVVVSASNSHGSANAASYPTEVVGASGVPAASEGPVIEGTAKVGERIFTGNGKWSGSRPLSYYYEWERCNTAGESCTAIEGATKPSYTVVSGDVGSTLRVKVTASNTLGNAGAVSAPAIVSAAGEASVERAIEIAQETDPSVLAPSTTASIEEQTVQPAITDPGEELVSSAALNSSTISKETPGEFAVNSADGEFSIQPIGTSPDATTTPTIVNGTAAVFAETSHATDTIVRPSALGATDLLQLRSSEAPTSFSWEVGIGPDQQLEELPDGNIAITEPGPGSVFPGSLPEELLEEPKTGAGEPSGEGLSGKAAEEELEGSVKEEGPLEKPPAAPQVTTSAITPKSGELHPQDTKTEYEDATSGLEYAKAHTANKVLAVIKKPTVLDAAGHEVSASLTVAGNTFTMKMSPGESAIFPLTADLLIPGDTGGTALPELHYGISDPKAEDFTEAEEETGKTVKNFDKHLESGPLHVKVARDVIPYNTTYSKLAPWLEAVKKAGLEPYITFGVVEECAFGKPCPAVNNPNVNVYGKDIERLIKAVKEHHEIEPEVIPAVERWGAWNEPDFHSTTTYDPLYNHAEKAALFWKKARSIIRRLGCDCTMVAGEFAEYDSYIERYIKTIRRNHEFWSKKPAVWGFHDYHDLVSVTPAHPYIVEYAKAFANLMNKRLGHPRIWFSEQGVELKNNASTTRLDEGPESLTLQRLAAHDFLHLYAASEPYVELVDYYWYKGPSKEQFAKNKYYFDSALLPGKEIHETQEPREAYCVIALGEEACPPAVVTKEPVPGTTTPTASTTSLSVNPGGFLAHYSIEYGLTTAYGHTTSSSAVTDENGTQSETVTLSGLEPCTTYHYQAEAESSVDEGQSSLGGDKAFTTECDVKAAALAANEQGGCALLYGGSIRCWGENYRGELGNGTTTSSSIPVAVSGITEALTVSVGDGFACAVLSDGHIKCWGDNEVGELGDGTTTDSSTPVTVSGITSAIAVAAGVAEACALLSDGHVECWGDNEVGELGDGTTTNSSVPVAVSGITDATAISAGGTVCALLSDGSVDCWGLGLPWGGPWGPVKDNLTPTAVGITDAISVAADGGHACAVLSGGGVKCLGENPYGQLGDGTKEASSTPVAVSGISNATAIATAGGSAYCGLLTGGSVDCWGDSGFMSELQLTPVPISDLENATAVGGGGNFACALLSDGGIDCWGQNYYGELGNGEGPEYFSATPVPVSGIG